MRILNRAPLMHVTLRGVAGLSGLGVSGPLVLSFIVVLCLIMRDDNVVSCSADAPLCGRFHHVVLNYML